MCLSLLSLLLSNSSIDDLFTWCSLKWYSMTLITSKKATTYKDAPPKLLKNVSDICTDHLLEIFNYSIENSIFPNDLKCADVSALHKKGETTKKNNYRPISILPTISKVLERLCDKQLSAYITNYLSPLLCGFRKSFSSQHVLSRLLEKWKIYLDSGGEVGAIFLDLSKAFDCLRHDVLIAKLEAYALSLAALAFIYNYLHGRLQRVNINGSFSSWKK